MKKLPYGVRVARIKARATRKIDKLEAIEKSGGFDNKLFRPAQRLVSQLGYLPLKE